MKKLLIGSVVLLALSGCGISGTNLSSSEPSKPAQPGQETPGNQNATIPPGVVCTMEAKLCPDGSYVGRGGPNCEFAACPAGNVPVVGSGGTTTPVVTNPVSTLQTYKNSTYNFQFDFPAEFTFVNANYTGLENKTVQVQMDGSAYPKTNLGDAAVAVGVAFAKSEKDCLALALPEGVDKFSDTSTINGQKFYVSNGSGAGAGNLYETKNYRAFANSNCFEITETIHTANIGNFDPGTVTEVDKNAVWKKLDGVVASFKLTK